MLQQAAGTLLGLGNQSHMHLMLPLTGVTAVHAKYTINTALFSECLLSLPDQREYPLAGTTQFVMFPRQG